ncbi:MAG: alpha-1,4-glucan--maltose-1-phosphate maltosyltransferase [Chloroflexota bacterium]
MEEEQFVEAGRVVVESLWPSIDCGRFPVKRVAGDTVAVEADIFADGHDHLAAVILYRAADESHWRDSPMQLLVNDRWRGEFSVDSMGTYLYTVCAWVDEFASWQGRLAKRVEAGQDVSVELLSGAALLEDAASRAPEPDRDTLLEWARMVRNDQRPATVTNIALSDQVASLACRFADRSRATTYSPEHSIAVDRERARFSAWYEMFPRSCSPDPGRHGTFRDCGERLDYIAGMGFDIVYLPPIHPVGVTARKGRNNALIAHEDDPGTPWAIGSEEGGHKSVNPQLGTLDDFRFFVQQTRDKGMEVALDIAFQCSPDHPYVKEHPDWFRWRPDGTIQYAENPPKKYQDIYPLEFENPDKFAMWQELRSIFEFWIEQGVRVFRVDNPHTKPFAFWEWCLATLKEKHPDLVFLSEAFTRPKVMYRLAKLGFTQSYTYFTWRRTKWELVEYITELTTTKTAEFFRPNFWPNTPDILMDYLQKGGRPTFMYRLVLAATLSSNYGIYGPAFELCINTPREANSEEYLDSEKYEVKHWDVTSADSISGLIASVNRIRRENPALQRTNNIQVEHIDNDMLIAYSKRARDHTNIIIVVVNIDPKWQQSGWLTFDLDLPGIGKDDSFHVRDLLRDDVYLWSGSRHFVSLDPSIPAHILRVELPHGPAKTEHRRGETQ